jgi:hypothetical protein
MTDFIEEAICKAQVVLTTESMASGELRCLLKSNNSQLVREIRIRDGAIMSASALLYHLLLNIQAFRMCDDFEDWLDEFDIDLPQDKAEEKYKQMQTDEHDMELLLGADLCNRTLAALEISQAINNAR